MEKKEKELANDENKLTKEYELSQRVLKDGNESLNKAIDSNDTVGIKVAQEMIRTATKKLDKATTHRAEQMKIRTDVGVKRKCAFEKLI